MDPLDKSVWTDCDYANMGWHVCVIRAIALPPLKDELSLDIDYIFKWVGPETEGGTYEFWLSPATMVFHGVQDFNATIHLQQDLELEIVDLHRAPAAEGGEDSQWTFDCGQSQISFVARGFTMFVRRPPILQAEPLLSDETRGGVSFARHAASQSTD